MRLLLATMTVFAVLSGIARAQEACPQWAQNRRAQLQAAALQLGGQIAQQGMTNAIVAQLNAINAEMAKLPPGCQQQSPGSGTAGTQCQAQWNQFNQCDRDFRFKLAAGQSPAYTCIKPTCVR